MVGATLQTLPHSRRTVLTWAGLRGAVARAAALSLPLSLSGRDVLLTLTFGIVLFTILAQGLTIRSLLERLGVGGEDGTPRDVELALGRLHTIDPNQLMADERRHLAPVPLARACSLYALPAPQGTTDTTQDSIVQLELSEEMLVDDIANVVEIIVEDAQRTPSADGQSRSRPRCPTAPSPQVR